MSFILLLFCLEMAKALDLTSWTNFTFSSIPFYGGHLGEIDGWVYFVNWNGYYKLNTNSPPTFDGAFNYNAGWYYSSVVDVTLNPAQNAATQVGDVIYFITSNVSFGLFNLTDESYTYPLTGSIGNLPYQFNNPTEDLRMPCVTYFNNHLLLIGGRGMLTTVYVHI